MNTLPFKFVRKIDCDFQSKLDYTREPDKFKTILIADVTCINLVLKHLKMLLNLPNVKSCVIKIIPTQNSFVKIFCISYWVVNKLPKLKQQYTII